MAKYIEVDKLVEDICNNTEPFNISSVIRTIYNQPTFNINHKVICEDCVFDGECDTHPMHCNSFISPYDYREKVKIVRF